MVIWKVEIPVLDRVEISWPAGSVPLAVQNQHGGVILWFRCDPEAEQERRWVKVVGTGNPLPADIGDDQYLGTTQMMNGLFVWHVFLEPLR